MESEKNTGGSNGPRRRSTDSKNSEEALSPPGSSFRSRLFTWFLAFGGVAALIATGRASHVLDTAVAGNLKQDKKLEIIITQLHKNDIEQNRILSVLEANSVNDANNVKQQTESDREFLRELRSIGSDVRSNREAIIVINGKVTSIDNTKVDYLASR